ncbi:Multidrug resistance protein MdtO [Paraburkholderia ultramafica]|uniref:Multidrug resistance protein MdtO n=2 Tax=Paraburkholderia ultramafica TaxID=1544867 RepID=A0A6S7C2A7_9BURK|nr:Multidrug resistance protein MdtO [Paraburkholderia ultramafica]
MSMIDYLPCSFQRFARFVGDEVRPYPGRVNVMLRCVLTSALVIIASMALQIPFLALSLIVVFYVTQANVVMTRLVGVLFFIGSTVAVGSAMLVLKLTYDYALLRILAAGVLFFVSVYLMRVVKIGVVFFIVGIIVIYVQTFVDLTDQAELLVRLVMWVWVAVNYAIALTLVINTLFLPAEPAQQLDAAMRRQLGVVDARLGDFERGASTAPALSALDIQTGMLTLQKLLRFATMRDPEYRRNQALQLARVAAVSRLYSATLYLPASAEGISADRVPTLRAACRELDRAIQAGERFVAPGALATMISDGVPGALLDMRSALLSFADRSATPDAKESDAEKDRLMVPDALTNPVYAQFALKTLMAAMFSYVFYVATDWQGIHTIMLSCLIVAQPSLGASSQRAILRIGGAAVGSLLALAMLVWIVPHIDGIVGLLMMSLPVIALGAWVTAGSERISYAGTQLMFTFALALLEHFGPTTNLTEVRDRMIGILLGVAVSTVVHASLWPEAEGEPLRQRLARLLRQVGAHLRQDEQKGPIPAPLWAELGDCEAMSARVALEPGWQWGEGQQEALTLRIQTMLAQAREILLAADAFDAERHALRIPEGTEAAVAALKDALAGSLDDYASNLSDHPQAVRSPSAVSLNALIDRRASDVARLRDDAARAAYDRLLVRARNLANEVSSLPGWDVASTNTAYITRASQT